MQISHNIIKDFVKLSKSISPEEISARLTDHTVEVEKVIYQNKEFSSVVVGKVLKVEKHPKADRLNLAEVDIKTEILKIVCGAPNLEEGQLVPVAKVGAILPGDFEIQEAEIRGEKSFGMICAEDELGLGDEHDGIMILDKSAKIGENFSEYLKLDDIIFEIDNKSLSNRPDLLNHYGIARELSAIFLSELKPYDKFIKEFTIPEIGEKLEVKVEERDICPKYLAIKIENIKIKESPAWLKERLIAIGQKPINNVVDIGNYVMFELGQPLHAFDADKVEKINVRMAKEKEKIETIDDKERILTKEDLVITDGDNVLAIAGIMGGKNSAVSDKTSSIILEAANFKDSSIRRSSQRLKLRSESSLRFEKALDPNMPELALRRFISILLESLPELKVVTPIIEVNNYKEEKKEIDLSFSWLELKIGQALDRKKAIEDLVNLGFEVNKKNEDEFSVIVPPWRATKDVNIKEDVLEEVLRLYGYNNVSSSFIEASLVPPQKNELRELERKIKNFLALKFSFFEVYNYSFVAEDLLSKLEIDFLSHLRIANPLSEKHNILRQSLIPNLSLNIKNNQFKADYLGFFEIGNVFFNYPGNFKKDNLSDEVLPHQEAKLGISIANSKSDIFLEAKGVVEALIMYISHSYAQIEFGFCDLPPSWSRKDKTANVYVSGKKIGIVSVLKNSVANKTGIKKESVFIELNFNDLFEITKQFPRPIFKEPVKFPVVIRDLAFVIDEEILYNEIKKEIVNFSSLINSVELFDVYQGEKLELGKKSLAFRINYLSTEKTLTSQEIDLLQRDLLKQLEDKFSIKLRDF